MGGGGAPLFMLDQLKHSGVPLKAQMSPYLQVCLAYNIKLHLIKIAILSIRWIRQFFVKLNHK
jgi:hypothetical protein